MAETIVVPCGARVSGATADVPTLAGAVGSRCGAVPFRNALKDDSVPFKKSAEKPELRPTLLATLLDEAAHEFLGVLL